MTARTIAYLLPLMLALGGCSPQANLLMAALPEGTASALLGHMQRVEDSNRRKIVELEQRQDWQGLIRFSAENVKRDPYTPDWWLVSGYAYTQLDDHARAAESYAEAVRLEPDVTLGWSLLAQSYRAAGQPRRAALVLDNALLARRDDPQLYFLLGETESDLRRWSLAAQAYREAVRLDESFVPAWYGLARAYGELGRTDEAREAAHMLEKLNPALLEKLKRGAPQ